MYYCTSPRSKLVHTVKQNGKHHHERFITINKSTDRKVSLLQWGFNTSHTWNTAEAKDKLGEDPSIRHRQLTGEARPSSPGILHRNRQRSSRSPPPELRILLRFVFGCSMWVHKVLRKSWEKCIDARLDKGRLYGSFAQSNILNSITTNYFRRHHVNKVNVLTETIINSPVKVPSTNTSLILSNWSS